MMIRVKRNLWYLSNKIPYTADPMIPPNIKAAPIKGACSLISKASAMMSTAVPKALKPPRVNPNMITK